MNAVDNLNFSISSLLGLLPATRSEALYLYDKHEQKASCLRQSSSLLGEALAGKDIVEVVNAHNVFTLDKLLKTDWTKLSISPLHSCLFINVCIDKTRDYFVTLRLSPIESKEYEPIRFVLVSVTHSFFNNLDVVLKDKLSNQLWRYNTAHDKFEPITLYPPKGIELEVIRLSSLGYSERHISSILHCALPTVKKAKERIFQKFGVSKLNQAVAYSLLYQLL